jgi:hypothetical protein
MIPAGKKPHGDLTNVSNESTLWLFNIAMENGPLIYGLPIKNGDFPWPC